jgi:hypothetical protein
MLDLQGIQPIHYAHFENTAVTSKLPLASFKSPWLTTPNLLAESRDFVQNDGPRYSGTGRQPVPGGREC